ncbi:hypothetical protein [Leifsonia sp. NPDC058248]|uniref:hypothetical protein n=1 Tax=Leifsonia sp. NPDC058248 TaxID=3346402 RepID=UPI0036DD5D1B
MTAGEGTPQFPEMVRRFSTDTGVEMEPNLVDHKRDAIAWLRAAERPDLPAEVTTALATIAQVHATLDFAKQQRIANLIAYFAYMPGSIERDSVEARIREGLGI